MLEITMEQQSLKWKFIYKFNEDNDIIIAKASKGLPTKRIGVLYENEQKIIEAIENNIVKIWLNFIPIISCLLIMMTLKFI